jgi:hypothetical protein
LLITSSSRNRVERALAANYYFHSFLPLLLPRVDP